MNPKTISNVSMYRLPSDALEFLTEDIYTSDMTPNT